MKQLIWAYNWIGPLGPLNNHKIPDVYDLAKRIDDIDVKFSDATMEHDPAVMEIGNFVPCKIIPSSEIKDIGDRKFFYEVILSPNLNYMSITMDQFCGFLQRTPIPGEVWDKIYNGNGYLFVNCRYESFVTHRDFQTLHDYFNSQGVPLNKVIYATNCANIQTIYDKYCLQAGVGKDKLNVEYMGLYIQITKDILRDEVYESRVDLGKQDRLFLNFNRRSHEHRMLLLLQMIKNDMLDDCHMSFDRHGGVNRPFEHFIYDFERTSSKYNLGFEREDFENLWDDLPFVLDSKHFDRFPVEEHLMDTAEWYDRTYIHLASETNFENNVIHLTEKTMKPIIFKQPFIIVGPAFTLQYLKKLGFKTFDAWWDEGYDEILNAKDRMQAIIKVCKDIKSWPEQKLKQLYTQTHEIREYNIQHFKNLKPVELLDLVEKYGANI
jgi:hypothetical protein